jgi:hypothetical protein
MRYLRNSLAGLVLLGLVCEVLAASEAGEMEVGKPFPLISLPALEGGHPKSVADFRGKKLVLHIWAAW